MSVDISTCHCSTMMVLVIEKINDEHYLTLQFQLTALMFAARRGHTAVVKELLDRQDLNINMIDKVHSVS